MKKYVVLRTCPIVYSTEILAESEEQALEIAHEMDGEDWCWEYDEEATHKINKKDE